MTTYKEIFGKQIKQLSTDPTDAGAEGQVWYNSTSGTFKTVLAVGAWSSGGTANVVAYNLGGAGTNTAALTMGGANSTGSGSLTSTEEYNGSAWTAVTGLPGGVSYTGGCGTQTAALLAGGANIPAYASTNSYEYDGSSWTGGGTMNTATGSAGQVIGIQTAALISGGDRVPGAPRTIANAEEYNGSAWTSVTSLPAVRQYQGTAGIQTAGVLWGGYADTNPGTSNTQYTTTLEYDGTNWTTGGTIPAARKSSGGSGTQSDALAFGGNPGTTPTNLTTVLNYNGTSWAANPASLASGRQSMASSSSGPSTAAFAAKGSIPAVTATMEVYNVSIYSPIAATWASGGNYPTGMNQLGGSGTQTAGLGFGGNTTGGNPNGSNITAEYNGSSWTSGGNLATARNTGSRSGLGTQTATMCINFRNDGTATPSFPIPPANNNYRAQTEVEEYNGSSWTAGTATPDGEVEAGTCGTISAALRFGGNPGNPPGSQGSNGTLYWNDSSWTSLNNMSTGRYGLAPAFQGTYNAALGFGGNADPAGSPRVSVTEEFNGTNWTAGGNLNATVFRGSGSGTQTAALSFGGTPNITATEGYDGTAWSTRPSLANGRSFGGGAGSNTAALYIAGDEGIHVEEFTGEIAVLDYKTLTSS